MNWSLINSQKAHTSIKNLRKYVNEHEKEVVTQMSMNDLKQSDYDVYVHE